MVVTFLPRGRQAPDSLQFRLLTTWWQRLRGLLGTRRGDAGASPVLLVPCASVHTWGMRYNLDVVLVGNSGVVLASWRGLPPRCLARAPGACCALERPSESAPWPHVGCRLQLQDGRYLTTQTGGPQWPR